VIGRAAGALVVALATSTLLTGCVTKAECERSERKWVQVWNPAQRYDGHARKWVGGWDDECKGKP
jgi:outer membrane biogenesis lipoprotein LolB